MSEVSKMGLAASSMRPGKSTSEFKGKTSVQALFILVVILQRFGVDVQLDEQTALLIIAGLEAAYTFGRSIVKGFQAKAVSDGPVINQTKSGVEVSYDQRGAGTSQDPNQKG